MSIRETRDTDTHVVDTRVHKTIARRLNALIRERLKQIHPQQPADREGRHEV